jgi:hypothetical protein
MRIYIKKNFISADLHYPERGRTHSEIVDYIAEFDFTEDTIIATLSDTVIKQINILIMRGKIDFSKVEVVSEFDDNPIVVGVDGFKVPSIDSSVDYLNIVHSTSYSLVESIYDDLNGRTVDLSFKNILDDIIEEYRDSNNKEEWVEANYKFFSLLTKKLYDTREKNID